MQKSWHLDDDKLTFIVLHNQTDNSDKNSSETSRMIGDVNLFFSTDYIYDSDTPEGQLPSEDKKIKLAECEIMIAEKSFQGQKLGYSIMSAMIKYAQLHNLCDKFIVKIGFDNLASQHVFKNLGFEEVSRSECFREITLELKNFENIENKYFPGDLNLSSYA